MSEPVAPSIDVRDVHLLYRLQRARLSFKEQLIRAPRSRRAREGEVVALAGVTFSVRPGEVLGVVGPNGAGKSTLMKLIARVLPPTSGRVIVRGHVAPLIELGAGFNLELSAWENIILYGAILGRQPGHMRARAQAIAEWAEVDHFLDAPLRSFSSGMLARLGFSVAIDSDPDVLIVDEVLSVGDESFQRKSEARIRTLIAGGAAVVFVSHSLDTVRDIADEVLWLDRGRVVMSGHPEKVVESYRDLVHRGQTPTVP